MTEEQLLVRPPITPPRRLGWFVIACAAASLALTAAGRIAGGSVRWTAWALPLGIAANAGILFLGALNRWPRLVRLFLVLSIVLAAAIIVFETLIFLHR
jgi:hypothetical protein